MLSLLLGLSMLAATLLMPVQSAPQTQETYAAETCAVVAEEPALADIPEEVNAEPRLFTQYAVSLRADDTYVYAVAKNNFTFLPSVVPVGIQLYYSDEYTEDLSEMTYHSFNFTEDLNMGEEITCRMEHDVTRCYRAVLLYWNASGTRCTLESASGIFDENGTQLR
ncbi:MAG TPA: hypothetical protein H9812_06630 [Candidatus Gallimonas intestinigallinarum]|uniref:Uncharacterized protein n=1 Tax=Candidatus Gallimonas intestinigallinarum TaxID=2838604 RepID=A0A9D2IWA5_9FIRM|nr:hypothetical protein [Candidatus Gallimonas intestinigallinarum]